MKRISILTIAGIASGVNVPHGSMVECENEDNCLRAVIDIPEQGRCEYIFENMDSDLMQTFHQLGPQIWLPIKLPCTTHKKHWKAVKGDRLVSQGLLSDLDGNRLSIVCFRPVVNRKLGSYMGDRDSLTQELDGFCHKFLHVRNRVREMISLIASEKAEEMRELKRQAKEAKRRQRERERMERMFEMFE